VPAAGAEEVNPKAEIRVTATSGTLQQVRMVNDGGKTIPGVLSPDARSWTPSTQLG
jgi:hypothetical protein